MSDPDEPFDDIVSGCLRMLRAREDMQVAFANSEDPDDPFIADTAPLRDQMPGGLALVVANVGTYAGGGMHTDDGVRLQVELFADQINADGSVESGWTRRRLESAWRVVDDVLHRVEGGDQWWGDIRTVSSERLARLLANEVPGSAGLWRGTAFYGVLIG